MAVFKQSTQQETLSKRAVEILHLLAEGMPDREIAEHLVMTINTVKWYNRQIYSILGVGSRTQAIARARELQLLGEAEQDERDLGTISLAARHNLPVETTHFIGRQREMTIIQDFLDATHLLTLVGPPGTGKTRLALRTAREMLGRFRDGVYFVSLASISDPLRVNNAIADAVDVKEMNGRPLLETLKHTFHDRQILLVLDNFEHLLSAATDVSELLSAAPDLKVLATSREPLHLYGEQEYAVPPLQMPDLDQLDLQTLNTCESTALFVQQARAVRADFDLSANNALDVARICIRLEGIPLAIELAAARIKLLTPSLLLDRLSSRLDVLRGGAQDIPPRQQTLHNTIAWSYNLLNEAERRLFARLAVFSGGCSLEAIEAICGDGLPIDVFDGLWSLVDKSLVQQKSASTGEPRFVMLEMVREYAREQLKTSDEAQIMYRRFADYFVELAEQAEPELRLAQQQHWFRLLQTEHENIRTVLGWSLNGGDVTVGVRLAGALCLYWFAYGHHSEGKEWADQLLGELENVPLVHHAKLLFTAGHMAFLYDLQAAQRYFARSLTISRELGNIVDTAWSLTFMGYAMMEETEAALTATREGLTLFRSLNHKPGIAQALNIVGEITCFAGDNLQAKRAYEECLLLSQEIGETRRIRFIFGNLTFIAQREEDYEKGRWMAEQALSIALKMDNKLDIADSLAGLAGVIGMTGQPEQATRLLGAWEAALEQMGAVPQPSDRPEHERSIAAIRAQLAPSVFESAWAEGRRMSLEQALASILEPVSL